MAVINVVPYNPDWPIIYEKESKLIKEALGDNCIEIHHIGSTSVPDLVAKPKIDMIAVVISPSAALKQLEKIGIQYRGEYNIPLHYGFSKRGPVDIIFMFMRKGTLRLISIYYSGITYGPIIRSGMNTPI